MGVQTSFPRKTGPFSAQRGKATSLEVNRKLLLDNHFSRPIPRLPLRTAVGRVRYWFDRNLSCNADKPGAQVLGQ